MACCGENLERRKVIVKVEEKIVFLSVYIKKKIWGGEKFGGFKIIWVRFF